MTCASAIKYCNGGSLISVTQETVFHLCNKCSCTALGDKYLINSMGNDAVMNFIEHTKTWFEQTLQLCRQIVSMCQYLLRNKKKIEGIHNMATWSLLLCAKMCLNRFSKKYVAQNKRNQIEGVGE